jgi:glycosyltransferase involved in cell wall biosynthesis
MAGDYVAASEKISRLITHPDELARMSRRAHEFIREKFDIVALDRRLIALYRQLMGESQV